MKIIEVTLHIRNMNRIQTAITHHSLVKLQALYRSILISSIDMLFVSSWTIKDLKRILTLL
jgi:hypothetical protein